MMRTVLVVINAVINSKWVGEQMADAFAPAGRRPDRVLPVPPPGAALGSVALSLCAAAHALHTRFTNIFGTSISETTI